MRRLTCGLVVIGLIFLISSCESLVVEEVPTLEREVAVSKTTPSISINNELITLLHIYDEFIQRMRKHGISYEQLRDISLKYRNKNKQIERLLGFSEEEANMLNYQFQKARKSLLQKYPELKKNNFNTDTASILENDDQNCAYGGYTACLIFSAITAPTAVLYLLGAYICYCGFCYDNLSDTLCIRT